VLQQNVLSATRVFAELSRTAKTPKRVVYSSSAFAMGYSHDALAWRPSKYPVTEADDPTPLETYGLSKDFGERAARLYCLANENVEVVALRFTNIIKRDKSADLPWPYDDRIPLAQWAWCHEDDVVDAHLKSLDAPTEALFGGDETPRFRALLVAAPSTRFAEPTADLLRRRFSGGEMMTWPETYETQPASIFDATQASTVLDWHPRDWRDVAPKEEEPQPSVEEKPSVRGSAAARACLEASSTRFFGLGGFQLDSGAALPDGARLAYTVVGSGPNIAVMPTSFGATHADVEYLARAVFGGSSENYSVYVFDMLGNGVSHSPSTTSDYPPVVTVADNVRAQRQALAEALGRDVSVSYAAGYSMGAMQAFEWARQDGVRSVIAICGASGCVDYNAVFLRALEKVLEPFVFEGRGTREDALAAFGAVYAGWGTGYPWYRDESWRDHGFDSLDDFLDRSYGGGFADDDPADLLAMVRVAASAFGIIDLPFRAGPDLAVDAALRRRDAAAHRVASLAHALRLRHLLPTRRHLGEGTRASPRGHAGHDSLALGTPRRGPLAPGHGYRAGVYPRHGPRLPRLS